MQETKAKLFSKIARMELAAKRGLQINEDIGPHLNKGSVISVDHCNATLKNCALFRKWVNECFELSESTAVPTSHAPE